MQRKPLISLLIVILLFIIPTPNSIANKSEWWDEQWSYRQEISIPIDTSLTESDYQPIDISIEFENTCWAKDTEDHSIRVILHQSGYLEELECQIYDLEHTDETHISSCNLVFLIPSGTTGQEKYYFYYDDEQKQKTSYPDHISVEESYCKYEPIPGYPYESDFFYIAEDEYIVYTIAQEGEIFGIGTSQQVTKLKPKSKKYSPSNGETLAFLDFWYYHGAGPEDYKSSCQKLLSKNINVDGNLMVSLELTSQSINEEIKTTANYKYYYTPTEDKRIFAHLKHEISSDDLPKTHRNYDGSYISLQTGGLKSNSIKELNAGKIYPFIHVSTEDNTIKQYRLYDDPEYNEDKWDITIIGTNDDIDLGSKSWACYDEGETGSAHAIILGSTSVVKSGENEKDGIQVQIYETGYPDLPGLENNVASLIFGRNSYEEQGIHDTEIPQDFIVELDAEIFSTITGSYKAVEKEAEIFQNLVKTKPSIEKLNNKLEDKTPKYNLTAYVHFASSIPMGNMFSAFTGLNFSYITAELYKDNKFISSNSASRISFNKIEDLKEKTLSEKIKSIFEFLNLRSFSIFKKVVFKNLAPGQYLVKIFKENPALKKERCFIGYQIISIESDDSTHIFCTPETNIELSVLDQNNKNVKNAQALLYDGSTVITQGTINEKGPLQLNAPLKSKKNYRLKTIYNGFLIDEKQIKLGLINTIRPKKLTIQTELYDFKLEIVDTLGLEPDVELKPILTSNQMITQTNINSEKTTDRTFNFYNLTKAEYNILFDYKSVFINETIDIEKDSKKTIVFPLEHNLQLSVLDTRGQKIDDYNIKIVRREFENNYDSKNLLLPPGTYKVEVYKDKEVISSRDVSLLGDLSLDLISNDEPIYPIILTTTFLIIAFASFFIFLKKKQFYPFLRVLIICILVISIFYPWWSLNSENKDIGTTTNLFIQPVKMVTLTTSEEFIGGEISHLPELFTNTTNIMFFMIILSCILCMLGFFAKEYGHKKLSKSFNLMVFILLVISCIASYIAISEMSNIGYGGINGKDIIDVKIVGQYESIPIACSWGLDIGFYLLLISTIMAFFLFIRNMKKR